MFAIHLKPALHIRKGSHPSSSSSDCGLPELPQVATTDDCLNSELPLLPISETGEVSPEFEAPAVVAEGSCPESEAPTMSKMKESCPTCPFNTSCQDKLQCSSFLTGFGEHIIERSDTEEDLGGGSGQRLFELLWSKT